MDGKSLRHFLGKWSVMDWKNLAAGGAIGGALLALLTQGWDKIKSIIWRIVSLLIVQVQIEDTLSQNTVCSYLVQNFRRSKVYDRIYTGCHENLQEGGQEFIPYETFGERTITFWNGWWPIILGASTQIESSNDSTTKIAQKTLTFVRWTIDIDQLLSEANRKYNDLCKNASKNCAQRRFFITQIPKPDDATNSGRKYSAGYGCPWYYQSRYRLLIHKPTDLGLPRTVSQGSALDNLVFPEHVKELIKEINIWRNNRDWYRKRGIPWKRGWLLYGPPGTGKTALVRAFAEDEDMPLFVFSLSEMINTDLQKSWQEMASHAPCIALFEDIDNVFHGRNNISKRHFGWGMMRNDDKKDGDDSSAMDIMGRSGMLTFDCLLNCLDGAYKTEGIFTVLTTNDITKIDSALGQPRQLSDGTMEFISTRPGRIDKAILLTYMEMEGKLQLAQRILGDIPEGMAEILQFLEKYPDLQETPAQFQERCSQLALKHFWKQQNSIDDGISPTNRLASRNGHLIPH